MFAEHWTYVIDCSTDMVIDQILTPSQFMVLVIAQELTRYISQAATADTDTLKQGLLMQ